MILFRKFRIKRLMARKQYLLQLIAKYHMVMAVLPPGLVLAETHLNDLDGYLNECEAISEKLLNLGVARTETKAIIDVLAKRETVK